MIGMFLNVGCENAIEFMAWANSLVIGAIYENGGGGYILAVDDGYYWVSTIVEAKRIVVDKAMAKPRIFATTPWYFMGDCEAEDCE